MLKTRPLRTPLGEAEVRVATGCCWCGRCWTCGVGATRCGCGAGDTISFLRKSDYEKLMVAPIAAKMSPSTCIQTGTDQTLEKTSKGKQAMVLYIQIVTHISLPSAARCEKGEIESHVKCTQPRGSLCTSLHVCLPSTSLVLAAGDVVVDGHLRVLVCLEHCAVRVVPGRWRLWVHVDRFAVALVLEE